LKFFVAGMSLIIDQCENGCVLDDRGDFFYSISERRN
jgi:hypothetical protein